jgi:hypothetical protein
MSGDLLSSGGAVVRLLEFEVLKVAFELDVFKRQRT